jgi:hypothetical protein
MITICIRFVYSPSMGSNIIVNDDDRVYYADIVNYDDYEHDEEYDEEYDKEYDEEYDEDEKKELITDEEYQKRQEARFLTIFEGCMIKLD